MEIRGVSDTLTVHDANLAGAHFSGTNLSQSRFDDIDLRQSAFANISLAGATFVDVDLSNASIANAKLDGMRIDGIPVHDLLRAHAMRGGAVLYAKDLERMQAFYRAVAGLTVEHAEDDHVVLASPGFQLVVLRMPEHVAASVEVASPPRRRSETAVKLVFRIADIAQARAAAAGHGGELLPPEREWDFQDCRVCDGHDPEGNVVQFRQPKP